MAQMIFVNLPVENVARATAFYEALGATMNPKFSNPQGSCMVLSDTICVMLLGHDFFRTFTPKAIADARTTAEVLICLSHGSREAVDDIADKALAAGARELHGAQDHGFMYGRAVEDLDGHNLELMWMDPIAAEMGPEAYMAAQQAA